MLIIISITIAMQEKVLVTIDVKKKCTKNPSIKSTDSQREEKTWQGRSQEYLKGNRKSHERLLNVS